MDYSYDYINGEIRFLNFVIVNDKNQELVFSVNTLKIQEVIEADTMTPLVASYLPFVGIYDLRGTPVPILDVNYKLTGHELKPFPNIHPRILICDVMGRLIGLQVPKILHIKSFNNEDVLPPPPDLAGGDKSFTSAVIRNENQKYFTVLDIEKMLEGYVKIKEESEETEESLLKKLGLNKHVLIVEDSKVFQKRAQQIFTKLGFKIQIAENGKQALEYVKKQKFDLIFCDIEMPLMNGLEFIGLVKQEPDLQMIPVIFNSSISTETMINEIKNRNLGEYIVKFDPDLIVSKVEKIFQKAA